MKSLSVFRSLEPEAWRYKSQARARFVLQAHVHVSYAHDIVLQLLCSALFSSPIRPISPAVDDPEMFEQIVL